MKCFMTRRLIATFALSALLTACASMNPMQERFAVCSYDHAWEAALEAVKDRAIVTKDKDAGMIVTGWLEIPMPGRTYGALQRDVGKAKIGPVSPSPSSVSMMSRRSVLSKSGNDGRSAAGRASSAGLTTDPSAEVMNDVQSRLDSKLKEQGCSLN